MEPVRKRVDAVTLVRPDDEEVGLRVLDGHEQVGGRVAPGGADVELDGALPRQAVDLRRGARARGS